MDLARGDLSPITLSSTRPTGPSAFDSAASQLHLGFLAGRPHLFSPRSDLSPSPAQLCSTGKPSPSAASQHSGLFFRPTTASLDRSRSSETGGLSARGRGGSFKTLPSSHSGSSSPRSNSPLPSEQAFLFWEVVLR